MARVIIAIDPGKSGGIAMLNPDGSVDEVCKMPPTTGDFIEKIATMKERAEFMGEPTIIVEKVNAGPKMGSSAAFKFGRSTMMIEATTLTLGMRLEQVTPQKWQKALGLITKGRGLGQGDTEKKNRNKARAQELFPDLKITHAIADALLIAEWARRNLLR